MPATPARERYFTDNHVLGKALRESNIHTTATLNHDTPQCVVHVDDLVILTRKPKKFKEVFG